MPRQRYAFVVKGEVQGVGFRWSARALALRLGLSGWIANYPDGSVRGEVEGEEETVQQFLQWCREGPRIARVREFSAHPVPAQKAGEEEDFMIREI
jgi:acylphosphatase